VILGIGADLCSIERIASSLDRFGARFLQRVFTPAEQAHADARALARAASYAKRWAAKEACVKALGTGFRDDIAMTDIAVANDPRGRPSLHLSGGAKALLDAITPPGHAVRIHLTLTDDPPWAQAFVVIEALECP
jgi:holo-[acyl-carrier protein] synthase